MEHFLFTPERLATLPEVAKHTSPLFTRWARWPGPEGEALRAQLERAATAVPPAQRRRVLGPLLSTSSSDAQVRDAMHLLLLAKTLADQGWEVEHEPVVESGLTPDLHIRRAGEEYFVEVRRVLGETHGWDKSAPLYDAVAGLVTRRPLDIIDAQIDGGASLKGFRRHVEGLRTGPLPEGSQVFRDRGVLV